jgi:hypothetical protein
LQLLSCLYGRDSAIAEPAQQNRPDWLKRSYLIRKMTPHLFNSSIGIKFSVNSGCLHSVHGPIGIKLSYQFAIAAQAAVSERTQKQRQFGASRPQRVHPCGPRFGTRFPGFGLIYECCNLPDLRLLEHGAQWYFDVQSLGNQIDKLQGTKRIATTVKEVSLSGDRRRNSKELTENICNLLFSGAERSGASQSRASRMALFRCGLSTGRWQRCTVNFAIWRERELI